MRTTYVLGIMALVGSLGVLAAQDQGPRTLRIGMISSLFDEQDALRARGQIEPFADLVRQKTQRPGDFVVVNGAEQMAADLKEDKLQLGVIHGWEYGWVKELCPDIEPLLVAVNDVTTQKAIVLVHKDEPAKNVDELHGKTMAMARRSPNFVKFYLDQLTNSKKDTFKVQQERDVESAIEAVVEKKAQLTAVSSSALKSYRDRKPVRAERVRVLTESPTFPAPSVIYRKGKVNEEVLARFKEAMLKANEATEGRQTLTLWRLSGFQPVPADYEKVVADILKAYPRKSEQDQNKR